ncbi:hypothetical protein [Coleofasciculus sp.]|uniref:hypothetical protein n=1 Tax=Coleofasciculus sp. TaxID=3100458 RepID=UPI0039F83897
MDIKLPAIPKDPEALQQLSKSELVTLVLQQQALLEQLLLCSSIAAHRVGDTTPILPHPRN